MGEPVKITRAELELLIRARLMRLANAVDAQSGMPQEPADFLRTELSNGLAGVHELVDQLRPRINVTALFEKAIRRNLSEMEQIRTTQKDENANRSRV